MTMQDAEKPPGELTRFVETIMYEKGFAIYRHDVSRLLVLLSKTLHQSPGKPWYRERYDVLGNYCHYIVVKMSFDRRETVSKRIPYWLNVLAGSYDQKGLNNNKAKINAFLGICLEVSVLLKKFGPDSVPTIPPPPTRD